MISDPSDDNLFKMALTKIKRDEFIVEIRKKKNQEKVTQKRLKLYRGDDDNPNALVPEANSNFVSTPIQGAFNIQPEFQLSQEARAQLEILYQQFYDALNQQSFPDLTVVIRTIRESMGDQQEIISGKFVIAMQIIPHLISLLDEKFSKYIDLQVEIAWLLANISAGTTEDTDYLVSQNIIPTLSGCYSQSRNDALNENVLWTFANICGENNLTYRDQILELGVLEQVARDQCKTPKSALYNRTAAWLISNLCRGKPYPSYEQVKKCFGPLTFLIEAQDERTREHVLNCLANLTESGDKNNLRAISENNLIPKVMQNIQSPVQKIAMTALKVTGNLAQGDKRIINNMCEHEIFKAMPEVLSHENHLIRKEACFTLSNIMATDFDDHDYMLENEILPKLLNIAKNDEDEAKFLATLCIYRFLTNCSIDEAMFIIRNEGMDILLGNLASGNVKIVDNSLQALFKIFECGENLKDRNDGQNPFTIRIHELNLTYVIEGLIHHGDLNIAKKADVILNRFFRVDYGF